MQVLVLEDSKAQARLLSNGLKANGFEVSVVDTIEAFKAQYDPARFSALILDRWVPDGDGISIVHWLRMMGDETPAIILTSLGELNKRLEGLRADHLGAVSSPNRVGSCSPPPHRAGWR